MKQLTTVLALSALGILAWLLSYRLSSDALALAIGLTFGALLCIGPLLLVLFSRQRQPLRRTDARVVHVTYNDNRQLLIAATPHPQWPQPQGMPLIADRQMARRRQGVCSGWWASGRSGSQQSTTDGCHLDIVA